MSRCDLWLLMAGGLFVHSIGCAGILLAADEPRGSAAVKELLEHEWDASHEARQRADDRLRQLPAASAADERVQQAYLLVLLKQQRYADAQKRAQDMIGAAKEDWLAWRAKIWLLLLTKKYTNGLVEIEQLCEALPSPGEWGEQADEFHDLARFLGLLFGFLEGPAGTAVTPVKREASLKKILARWDSAAQEAFEAGRSQVKDQQAALLSEHDQADQAAERKASELREQMRKDVASEREGVEQRRDSVTEEANRTREEYQSQKRQLATQEAPLANELARIQTQALAPQSELVRLDAEIAGLQERLQREKDSGQRDRLRREIDRVQGHVGRQRAQLAALERSAADVSARLAGVKQERQRLEAEAAGKLGRTESALTDLQRRESKADAAEKNARKVTGDKRRSNTLATRAAALTTYAPFPLEEEKQKLLQGLKDGS